MSKCDNSKIIWKYFFGIISQNDRIDVDETLAMDDNIDSGNHNNAKGTQ